MISCTLFVFFFNSFLGIKVILRAKRKITDVKNITMFFIFYFFTYLRYWQRVYIKVYTGVNKTVSIDNIYVSMSTSLVFSFFFFSFARTHITWSVDTNTILYLSLLRSITRSRWVYSYMSLFLFFFIGLSILFSPTISI